MIDCPFCVENALLYGEILKRDSLGYVVENPDPILRSSVMVIPTRHVATPFELSSEEWIATHALLLWAKTHLDALKPDGYSIGWNVQEIGGQAIPHAHLHVIGRFADEPMAGQGIRYALKQPANLRRSQHYSGFQ